MKSLNEPLDFESFLAGRLKSVLLAQPDDLEGILSLLNGNAPLELTSEVRKLVDIWQKSGPNLRKMLRENRDLARRVRHGRTELVPTETGKGHLLWLPELPDLDVSRWKDQAICHFMDLVLNPQWHKLGGPCQRCGDYYIKKTVRQKAYCSRRCGSAGNAVVTTRRRREEEHRNKVCLAQKAADAWTTIQTRQPWKRWVSEQTKITVKWLTRAANTGELREPIKR